MILTRNKIECVIYYDYNMYYLLHETSFGVRGFPAIMTILRSNQTTHYPEGRIKNPHIIAR